MKRLLSVLAFVLSLGYAWGQNNVTAKGIYSTNVLDTAYLQTSRTTYQNLYGNTGLLFFNKTSNKWRYWDGPTSTYKTLGSGGGGSFTSLTGINGLTVSGGPAYLAALGGTIGPGQTIIEGIGGSSDLFFGSVGKLSTFQVRANALTLESTNGIQFVSPLKAGTNGFTPLQFQSGSLTSPVQNGGFGYNGTHLYFGIGGTNYQIDQQSTAGGSDRNIQFNNASSLGGDAAFNWRAIGRMEIGDNSTTGASINKGNSNQITLFGGGGTSGLGSDNATGGFILSGAGASSITTSSGGLTITPSGGPVTVNGQFVNQLVYNAQSGTTYTFVLTDHGKIIEGSNAGATTFTIPTNASVAFSIGDQILIAQYGVGQITIAPAGGVTMRSDASKNKTNAQYALCTLIKRGTDEWYLSGDISN